MTLDEYFALVKRLEQEQGGVCAICGGRGKRDRLVLDHIPGTFKTRGLLCDGCNLKMSLLDSPIASAALIYHRRYD